MSVQAYSVVQRQKAVSYLLGPILRPSKYANRGFSHLRSSSDQVMFAYIARWNGKCLHTLPLWYFIVGLLDESQVGNEDVGEAPA